MIATISAGELTARIDSMGAQLTSLALGEGNEYLWQGDPTWWSGQSPVLFPIVGSLRGDQAHTANGDTHMGRHGLARRYEHALVASGDDSAIFEFVSTPETREKFPYDFRLRMSYTATAPATLEQRFSVTNTGEDMLPFAVGGHPAFNVPCPGSDSPFEAYELRFSHPWSYAAPDLEHESGLLDFRNEWVVMEDADRVAMDRAIFRTHDTIVFRNVPDSTVTLADSKTGHGVRLDFEGFEFLGVWSEMHDAPFVAVEPWTGCATATDEDDELEHKRGMRLLAPGETAEFAYRITLL